MFLITRRSSFTTCLWFSSVKGESLYLRDKLSRFVKSTFLVRSTNLLNLKSFVDKIGVSLKVTISIEYLADDEGRDLNSSGSPKLRAIFKNFTPLFSKKYIFLRTPFRWFLIYLDLFILHSIRPIV